MDRRAKKLEKKKKNRERAKKKAAALAARKPSGLVALARAAANREFGPCFVSAGWDDLAVPALVSVIVTRRLATGELLPSIALIDRTCLGVKNAFVAEPTVSREFEDLVDEVGFAHDGMVSCELLVLQSIVFHAIDYARSLGFEPHRDFLAEFFGPRPAELLSTPWYAPERPIYISGPHDRVPAISDRLTDAVGAGGFEFVDPSTLSDDDAQDEDDDDEIWEQDDVVVYSPLQRTVSRDGVTLCIAIYRGPNDVGWHLELEDHLGGSTVWQEQFATDQAALDAALLAIEQEPIESFVVEAPEAAPANEQVG